MIIIVDGGSTKARIRVLDGCSIEKEYILPGINPYYQKEEDIYSQLSTLEISSENITNVYHYGAGCSFDEKKLIVKNAWSRFCPNAEILVESDMVGAAKALFGDASGIACILGTGANSCFYENGKMLENVPPLGFILGDEGSGAYIGAKLVANCMKNIFNKALVDDFYATFNCTAQSIMDGVYKGQFPSRHLASFVPFVAKNIHLEEMQQLVLDAFRKFFERNVMLYKQKTESVGFVGGVAKQFEKQLNSVALEYGFSKVVILGEPMDRLVSYHKQQFSA